jgi:hypothetical protein
LLQVALVDVMLVLTDADAARVQLDQLRERVHQAATDRHCAADRDVAIRKFFPRDV